MKVGFWISASLLLFSSTSCVSQSLGEWIGQQEDLSTLLTLLNNTEASFLVPGSGSVLDLADSQVQTLFAPVNNAFAQLDPVLLNRLGEPPYSLHLALILLAHTVRDFEFTGFTNPIYSPQLFDGAIVPANFNEFIRVTITDGVVTVQNSDGEGTSGGTTPATVTEANLNATNGAVVHKIDEVLLPEFVRNDVVTAMVNGVLYNTYQTPVRDQFDAFSTLSGLIVSAGLEGVLRNNSVTIFAPTNDAFLNLPLELLTFFADEANVEELISLLTYHVCPAVYTSKDFAELDDGSGGGLLPTFQGNPLPIFFSASRTAVANSYVSRSDLLASNGVVHAVELVMYTVPQLMLGQSDLSFFVNLTKSVDLTTVGLPGWTVFDELSGRQESVTLFAPVNAAFEALDQTLLDRLTTPDFFPHLSELLSYHELSGAVPSTELTDGMMLPNPEDWDYTYSVSLADGSVFLITPAGGSVEVIEADLLCVSGIVHKVNSVLLPQFLTRDTVDVLVAGGLSTLVALVQFAGLEDTLRSGAFTVFAPINDAFAALSNETIAALTALGNEESLRSVLTYHVIPGVVLIEDPIVTTLTTVQGSGLNLTVTEAFAKDAESDEEPDVDFDNDFIRPGLVTVNDANVLVQNGLTSTGAGHIIDSVLLPPGFVVPDIPPPTPPPTLSPVGAPTGTPAGTPTASPGADSTSAAATKWHLMAVATAVICVMVMMGA